MKFGSEGRADEICFRRADTVNKLLLFYYRGSLEKMHILFQEAWTKIIQEIM